MQPWFLTFHIRVILTHFSFEKESYYKAGASTTKKKSTSYCAGVELLMSLHMGKGAHNNSMNGRWLCL